ncbi:MAG: phosphoribosyltransferase [bacterium]
MVFKDRADAGKKLAEKLINHIDQNNTIVIGLPRGGVVVAFEVAKKLKLPLDIIVSRKIGMPGQPEFAVGAITADGKEVFDQRLIQSFELERKDLEKIIEAEKKETLRRMRVYRPGRAELNLKNKTVILVDDGVATGMTMQATLLSARGLGAKRVIIAVPVIPQDQIKGLARLSDELIYLDAPVNFGAISIFYQDFSQVNDEQVIKLMQAA